MRNGDNMKIHYKQKDGAGISFYKKRHVSASYTYRGLKSSDGNVWHADILRAGATLNNGQHVEFFLNRATGLVVVDVLRKGGRSGMELLRQTIDQETQGQEFRLESLISKKGKA